MVNNNNPWEDDNISPNPADNTHSSKIYNINQKKMKKTQNTNDFFSFKWEVKWVLLALLTLWIASGFYQIEPNEQGVVLMFGEYNRTVESGLRYHLPFPIEDVTKVNLTQERSFTLGDSKTPTTKVSYRGSGSSSYDNFTESHMLTGDENIVDINLTVVWKVKDAKDYLFSLREPDQTVYVAAQSVLREIVGQSEMQAIITGDREKVQEDTKTELQKLLNEFNSGVQIVRVRLQKADPPQQVVDAFNEVQRARADMVKFQNQAEAYRNEVLPNARGDAAEITNAAEAYKERVINEAEGEAKRFQSVYSAYKQGRDVTSTKMYMETMQEVMNKSNKVIIDPSAKGSNVLPILPINK